LCLVSPPPPTPADALHDALRRPARRSCLRDCACRRGVAANHTARATSARSGKAAGSAAPDRPRGPAAYRSTTSAASIDTVSTTRSEEHTSELQSREKLVCRLLLE